MNDNEKLALAKALTANSRRMMELVKANNALVEFLVRSLEQSQAVTAIDWSDAPDWAKYAAQDEDGEWWWYEEEPYIAGSDAFWNNRPGSGLGSSTQGEYNPNWRDTLQARPQNESVASGVRWDLIPAMYNWIAKDGNDWWWAYSDKPERFAGSWAYDDSVDLTELDEHKHNLPSVNWRESLMQRPVQNEAAVDEKPSWDKAPEWARWLAQDYSGGWYWYSHKPVPVYDRFVRSDGAKFDEFRLLRASDGKPNPSWQETLEERPSDKFAVNWSYVPTWAQWVARDGNGAVWAYESRPVMRDWGWYPDRTNGASATPISRGQANPLWKKTLTQRPQPAVWDNAPEWANWLAMDKNGRWFWYSDEPKRNDRLWVHSEDRSIHQHYEDCPLTASDWTKSLQKRPR